MYVSERDLYTPQLIVLNGLESSAVPTTVRLESGGRLSSVPRVQMAVFCELNLRRWPFDTQTCTITIGSFTHTNLTLTYKGDDAVDDDSKGSMTVPNAEWELVDVVDSVTKNVLQLKVRLRRRTASFKTMIVIPCSSVILMTLAGFWLPALAGEKILLNGITAVIIDFFIMYFAQRLPVMGIHTPLVVLFYSSALYMICFSVLVSVIVITMARTKQAFAVPWTVRQVIYGPVGRALLLSHLWTANDENAVAIGSSVVVVGAVKGLQGELNESRRASYCSGGSGARAAQEDYDEVDDDNGAAEPRNNSRNLQLDWIILATAIDRTIFVIYSIAFIVLAALYYV